MGPARRSALPGLPHRVRDWAREHGRTPTQRDADEVVAWLRALVGSEYARKPADGLRRQVIRAIQADGTSGRAAGVCSWATDTSPEPQPAAQPKRPLPAPHAADDATETAVAKVARSGAPEASAAPAAPAAPNLLNASLRAAYATDAAAAAAGAATVAAVAEGRAAAEAAAPATEASTAAGGSAGRRTRTRERRGERRGDGAAAVAAAAGDASRVRYTDVGGIDGVLQEVRELVEYPLTHPEIYAHLGVDPPRGLLLHGPPGCGKTLLAQAIAGELGVFYRRVSAPELVSGMSGESESKIRQLFAEAREHAPALIFIDEIDAIAPKRETAQREMERRIVAQLLTSMDDLASIGGGADSGDDGGALAGAQAAVIVLGATNRPDALDAALRRAGRFDREIALGIPDAASRVRILQVLCRRMRLSGDLQLDVLAKRCVGFVGADLGALCKEAAVIAVNRIFGSLFAAADGGSAAADDDEEATDADGDATTGSGDCGDAATSAPAPGPAPAPSLAPSLAPAMLGRVTSAALKARGTLSATELAPLAITMGDFEAGLEKVQPSAKREGFATIPDVEWADVGALGELRAELQMAIVEPIRRPERFEALGLQPSCGVLLYGPPGCGKTLVAKAIANECGASFIAVRGPELLNKYVGESEKAVRQLFARGRASAPCVVFFDEIDALTPRRGGEGTSQATERVVNQMLTELDGLDGRTQLFFVAATNRPDILDPAMLRPGRLDKLLYVPIPHADAREAILRTAARRTPLDDSVDLAAVARDGRCAGFSGADLAALLREAAVAALSATDGTAGPPRVSAEHFEVALRVTLPSVSPAEEQHYQRLAARLRTSRA